MLRIDAAQLQAFQTNTLRAFLAQAVIHIRRDMAELAQGHTDPELIHKIETAMTRARRYGLTTKREIMCFVDVTLLLGEHFDTDSSQPWATALLTSTKLSSGDKGNLLLATACSVYRDMSQSR